MIRRPAKHFDPPNLQTHTCVRARTHARTHAHTHTHTHTHTLTHTHIHTHKNCQTNTRLRLVFWLDAAERVDYLNQVVPQVERLSLHGHVGNNDDVRASNGDAPPAHAHAQHFLAQPHPPARPSTHVRARTHQGLLRCRLLHFCFAVEAKMVCEGLSDDCVCVCGWVGGWVGVCARVCVRAHTRLCVGGCPCARARTRASAQSCDRGYDTLACRYQRYEISKAEHS